MGTLLVVATFVGCTTAKTVTCLQLNERSMRWQEPKVALWQYQGTRDGFHYFYFVDLPVGHSERYRVPSSELATMDSFPLTPDRNK